MNDIPVPSSDSLAHQSDENRLTAEVYEDFHEALDILYIKGNLSGRLKFLESWPDAGQLIFGQELIGFDHDGVSDLERRSALEDEAEERRLELLEIAQTLEEKSVDKSVLQIEYVEALVKKLDRDLALLFYSPKIVNRFIPPPPEPEVVEDASEVEQQEMGAVSNDPLNTDQKDIEALADQIAPEAPQAGAPSASNPVVDAPEPPKKARPQNPAQAAQADLPDPFAEKPAAPEPGRFIAFSDECRDEAVAN